MLHIPLLRHGKPYRSLDVVRAPHYQTRQPFVEISQANLGLIRRDLLEQEAVLLGVPESELEKIDEQPASIFQRFRPTLPWEPTTRPNHKRKLRYRRRSERNVRSILDYIGSGG